ncbi:MAG: type II toxin-antitoxin system VapC family toxin [Hyphomicrobiaceae bacterium]|nr:type II toxin-antitoxin system VapC family toxin [Hyphomicrobiaceae bacterium]
MMLLDTSGLLAILDRREPQHELACLLYRQARLRITHGFVLAELVALGLVRGFPSSSTIDFLRDLIANPDITVIWPAQDATAQALSYLTGRPEMGYSLCDVVSFLAMNQFGVSEALTTDAHFERAGFRRLLA